MHIEKPDMYSINPTAVHLTWNAARVPSATSQLSPTTYRVEVREDGTFNWVEKASNITGLGCDIGGLDPLADYAFRVRAVNDFGWSEATLPAFLHRPISECCPSCQFMLHAQLATNFEWCQKRVCQVLILFFFCLKAVHDTSKQTKIVMSSWYILSQSSP